MKPEIHPDSEAFIQTLQHKSDEDYKQILQDVATFSICAMRGIQGQKFTKEFLRAAIRDDLKIQRRKAH